MVRREVFDSPMISSKTFRESMSLGDFVYKCLSVLPPHLRYMKENGQKGLELVIPFPIYKTRAEWCVYLPSSGQ